MIKTNFHTHTIHCDGKDTPEALVSTALEKGFTTLGFSGHSYLEVDAPFCMTAAAEKQYYAEVNKLKETYRGKLEILCGIEQDIFSPAPAYAYDYIIGSVHHVLKDGKFLMVDGTQEQLAEILKNHYGGAFDLFAKEYFELVATVAEKTKADVIGHVDLVLKNQEKMGYTPTKQFYSYAMAAVEALLAYNKPFEINTGAMARGSRTTPYPDMEILKFIQAHGGSILFSSDCHNKVFLDYGFETAKQMATAAGFREQAVITSQGMQYAPIE